MLQFTLGFRDRIQLLTHHQKHEAEFGFITVDEYEMLADTFLGGPIDIQCQECIQVNRNVVRFNPTTNEFGIVTNTGIIVTYFKPDPFNRVKYPTNMDYYMEQCKK